MPVSIENLNKEVYDVLRSHGNDPIPLDSTGKQDIDIQDSDVFRFTYKKDGNEIGTGWVTVEGKEIVFYIGDDLSSDENFLNFLQFMKRWSQRKLLGFKITNKDHLTSDMKKRTSMKNKEQLGEGYYPMGKKASYNDSVPQVKIILQHTRQIEEGEQRFRNVAKIFVENVDGERFLLPTNRPGLARVYARHIAEGGTPYDDKGRHITTLVEEYQKMAGFVRATRNGQFNESAQRLVNEGVSHYNNLRETLTRMAGRRGYHAYFESYTPVLNEESTEETNLNELFVQETLDPRIESVLPILNRLSKNITEMSTVKELAEWADSITEVEDQTTKTLAEPADEMLDESEERPYVCVHAKKGKHECKASSSYEAAKKAAQHWGLKSTAGIDAYLADVKHTPVNEAPGAETLKHNQNTEKSNLKAFDLAEDDMEEGAKDVMKNVRKKFRKSAVGRAREYGYSIEEGFSDSRDVADQIIDSIGGEEGLTGDDIYRAVDEYQSMMDNPHKLDTDEVVQIVMDRLNIQDDLDENKLDQIKKDLQSDKNKKGLKSKDLKDILKLVGIGIGVSEEQVEEDLDANQKRVGQLGPTEPVGKNEKNLRGKLVGASESVELDALKALSGIK